ncbi:MAG: SDR family oxidoreductase [Balneolaceae bacterium]|nr:SDR family oxidoreductase [Balneolaceae bacterium]
MNIIVTGASRGIGYETVKRLARDGHTVIGTARSQRPLEQLKAESPDRIDVHPADLTDENSLNALIGYIADSISGVDVLVNNAGSLINKPFEKLKIGEWQKMIDVNLFSAVRLIRKLLPQFADGAHIVNVSSMGGFQGSSKYPGLSAYSVSKGALATLAECLAEEFSDRNIRVNALCLGAVETEMFNEAFPGFEAPLTAEEMGAYLADFAVDGSNYYNGQVLPVALGNP